MSKQKLREKEKFNLENTTADPLSMKEQLTSVTEQLLLSKALISSNEDNTARLNNNFNQKDYINDQNFTNS